MRFSIVIPTYNNLDELRLCLQALDNIQRDDFEVFVCIDGSQDGTYKKLRSYKPRYEISLLQHPDNRNQGRAAARNLSLDLVKGDFVVFLDSDMRAAPDLLDKHEEVVKDGNSVSLGHVEYENRKENIWPRYISTRGISKFKPGSEVPSQYFITPNTALPSKFFKELGGFDENIKGYGGEDMEFGHRVMQKYDPRFVYNPAAVVKTIEEKTFDKALEQLRGYASSGLPYIIKKYPELNTTFWVHKVNSGKFGDRMFGMLTRAPFTGISKFLLHVTPFGIKKKLMNHLVISAVHAGWRSARK